MSIKQHGVLQPIVVAPDKEGYVIVAGERRWHASKMAGLKTIPAIVRTLDDQSRLEVALIENIQREDLSPLELATAYAKLNQEFNLTYKDISMRVGKGRSTVVNIVRLLSLPPPAKRALMKGKITEGHARQILALEGDPKRQQELLDLIIRYNWTVRRAEQFVVAYKEGASSTREAIRASQKETEETKRLSKVLGAKVRLWPMAKGGRLIIEYKSKEELKKIYEKLTGKQRDKQE